MNLNLNSGKRAVVIENIFEGEPYTHLAVLMDIAYWNENYDILQKWATENKSEVKGMIVHLNSPETATLFSLRWL